MEINELLPSNCNEIQRDVSASSPKERKTNKKYIKVNQNIRRTFLQCIIKRNMSIKQASQHLNINYSSAKQILSRHRRNFLTNLRNTTTAIRRASYTSLVGKESSQHPVDIIICSIGGQSVSQVEPFIQHYPIQQPHIIIFSANKDHSFLQSKSNSQESSHLYYKLFATMKNKSFEHSHTTQTES